MKWVRLDVAFPRNHKILALVAQGSHRAITAYVCGLSYAGEQETDGFIPKEALPQLHARPAEAKKLVDAGLWIADPGGWLINGWSEFQPSTQEMQQRRNKARTAAAARWEGHEAMSDAERARRYRERKRASRHDA